MATNEIQRIFDLAQLYVFERTGTVVTVQSRLQINTSTYETVRGNGDQRFVDTSTKVSSDNLENLFIHDDKGGEFEFEIRNPEFHFREGHRVTVVYAGDQKSKRGYGVAIFNHDTKKRAVWKGQADLLAPPSGLVMGCLGLLLVTLGAQGLYIFYWMNFVDTRSVFDWSLMNVIPGLVAFGFVAYTLQRKSARRTAIREGILKAVSEKLESAIGAGKALQASNPTR